MTSYTNVKVRISEGQRDKLNKVFESNCESIATRLTSTDLNGEDVIVITKSKLSRLMKAYEANKDMTIKMSRSQMAYNKKIDGGFLPMLTGLIPFLTGTVLPASEVGALSGLASTGVQKLIENGLYLKKGWRVCQNETDGRGLYLGPASDKRLETVWNGLYLMKQGGLYDGRGLFYAPTVHLKISPFLVWFYNITFGNQKKILYTLKKMEIYELYGNYGIYIVLKNGWNTEILTAERDNRNELSTIYSRGVNIIGVIDNCLGVTEIGLGITGVGLLSTIVAAPAVIWREAVSIVMDLLRVVGNQATKKLSLKIEKHEKIAMLAVSSLNTISSFISKSIIRWLHYRWRIFTNFIGVWNVHTNERRS